MAISGIVKYLNLKYKMAQIMPASLPKDEEHLKNAILANVKQIYNYIYNEKLYNIIQHCGNADINVETIDSSKEIEKKAYLGHIACKIIVQTVEKLLSESANSETFKVGQIVSELETIIKTIDEEISPEDGREFSNIGDCIYIITKSTQKTTYTKNLVKEYYSKAKQGLMRVYNLSKSTLRTADKLNQRQNDIPMPERNEHRIENVERKLLSVYDIKDFITHWGPEYGLPTTAEWTLAILDDKELKNDITTVINALNRGKIAKNDSIVKKTIKEIITRHNERSETNKLVFEENKGPETLIPKSDEYKGIVPGKTSIEVNEDSLVNKLSDVDYNLSVLTNFNKFNKSAYTVYSEIEPKSKFVKWLTENNLDKVKHRMLNVIKHTFNEKQKNELLNNLMAKKIKDIA